MTLYDNNVGGTAYYWQSGYYCFIKDEKPHVLIYGAGYGHRESPWYSRGYFIDIFSSTPIIVGETGGSTFYTDGQSFLKSMYELNDGDYEIISPENLIDWIRSAYIKLNSLPVFENATKKF